MLWRSRWAALGAVVAVTFGAGAMHVAQATVGAGPRSTYVSIRPCRLIDSRAGDTNVGPRSAAPHRWRGGDVQLSSHSDFDFGTRRGTFGSGGGTVLRNGVWRGSKTKNPWPIYPIMTEPVHAASDHAATYADINF